MKKYVPFEKLSKKEQKRLNNEKRNDWGLVNPVTRRVESKKAYNRNHAKQEARVIFVA